MKEIRKYIWVGLVGLLCCSCSDQKKSEPLRPAELVKWVQDPSHGLHVVQDRDQFQFALQYKPYDYIVAMEERRNAIPAEVVTSRKKELEGVQYYNLKITSKTGQEILATGIVDEQEYYHRMNYCTSMMQQDLFLLQGGDTIPSSLCVFERNYGLANYNQFVVTFNAEDSPADREIIFVDRAFSGDILRFKVEEGDLQAIPKLKHT